MSKKEVLTLVLTAEDGGMSIDLDPALEDIECQEIHYAVQLMVAGLRGISSHMMAHTEDGQTLDWSPPPREPIDEED